MNRLTKQNLIDDFIKLGLKQGDVVLVRANLGAVGKISGGAAAFVDALLQVIGAEGTLVSLAFTDASFFRKPKIENAFHSKKKSYAGALPNVMIERDDAFRSQHPMCSYVAIGKFAKEITDGHDERSPAYEPIRKIVDLNGKNLLIGCVASSPGFTTTHLVESDLGMLRLTIFSRLISTYYLDKNGNYSIFHRKDSGLCSNSFYKFYAHYVKEGILKSDFVGEAYSIVAPAKKCYEIDSRILKNNRKFNICDSVTCFTCNANRRDRIYRMPGFFARLFLGKISAKAQSI